VIGLSGFARRAGAQKLNLGRTFTEPSRLDRGRDPVQSLARPLSPIVDLANGKCAGISSLESFALRRHFFDARPADRACVCRSSNEIATTRTLDLPHALGVALNKLRSLCHRRPEVRRGSLV